MDNHPLTIYIDGAARGNPGPAGIGIIFYKENNVFKKFCHYIGETTNNVAEYTALIYGLQEALYLKAGSVTVFSDSELMVRQINGEYRVKDHTLRIFYCLANNLIKKFQTFKITHIPRGKNKEADLLANKGIDESRLL